MHLFSRQVMAIKKLATVSSTFPTAINNIWRMITGTVNKATIMVSQLVRQSQIVQSAIDSSGTVVS